MTALHPAMAAHLHAVTQDASLLRDCWAADGVLEFPYATADMTSRIEGVDALVAFFDGPRRWTDWTFEARDAVVDETRNLVVTEVHGEATVAATGGRYVQDYVVWMTLDGDGRITSWREYWDKERV